MPRGSTEHIRTSESSQSLLLDGPRASSPPAEVAAFGRKKPDEAVNTAATYRLCKCRAKGEKKPIKFHVSAFGQDAEPPELSLLAGVQGLVVPPAVTLTKPYCSQIPRSGIASFANHNARDWLIRLMGPHVLYSLSGFHWFIR